MNTHFLALHLLYYFPTTNSSTGRELLWLGSKASVVMQLIMFPLIPFSAIGQGYYKHI